MRSMILVLATVVLLGGASAAQAHDDDHHGAPGNHGAAMGEPGDAKAKARTVAITASDKLRFTPAKITVKRGETIRFVVTNTGQAKHEMILGSLKELRDHAKLMQQFPEMEHDDPNAVSMQPGQTAELLWKFTKAGAFYFGCLVPGHFEGGMKGSIVVSR